MTRTIGTIQEEINQSVAGKIPGLTEGKANSKTSEWRLWTHIVATAIHAFELILELFRKEVDTLTNKITPGTVRWYAEMCRRFQYGHSLAFDEKKALLYYEDTEDEASKIIAAVSIVERDTTLAIKVAKYKDEDKVELCPLEPEELQKFKEYIDNIKFAGCKTEVTSVSADELRYEMTVYRNPAYSEDSVIASVRNALQEFKTGVDFDSVVYRQKVIDAVMHVEGVVTCRLELLTHSYEAGEDMPVTQDIETHAVLHAGYFNWAKDSVLKIETVNDLLKG